MPPNYPIPLPSRAAQHHPLTPNPKPLAAPASLLSPVTALGFASACRQALAEKKTLNLNTSSADKACRLHYQAFFPIVGTCPRSPDDMGKSLPSFLCSAVEITLLWLPLACITCVPRSGSPARRYSLSLSGAGERSWTACKRVEQPLCPLQGPDGA